jgi:hypothetical protein
MKILLALLCMSIFLTVNGQKAFDSLKIDSNTKLIGTYSEYDRNHTYDHYNFLIDDSLEIINFIKHFRYGKEVDNIVEQNEFTIRVIKNYNQVSVFSISPTYNSIRINGHSYKFDLKNLKSVSEMFPFKYKIEKNVFRRMAEYQSYFNLQIKDKMFLFKFEPYFSDKGNFEIEFPRNSKFSSPKAISEYIKPLIEKIVSKDDYDISYALNEKNMNDQSQFTMTITGRKELFDKLKVDNLKNINWSDPKKESTGWFYYKTN